MKPRIEYEKLMDKTFTLVGDAQAKRIEIDLLLDIRELLMWMQEDALYQRAVRERQNITTIRETFY